MSRQRTYAILAHSCVLKAKNAPEVSSESYRTHCMTSPGLLQKAGAVQALAFLQSREEGSDAGRYYMSSLAQVLFGDPTAQDDKDRSEELFKMARECSLPQYLALSRKLLDASAWLRRFAQIEIPAPSNDKDNNPNKEERRPS